MLVVLLLVATAISTGLWLYERDSALPYEAIAIFAIVLLNAVMGYIQEFRAESALAALKQMAAAHANVIRDGERRSIPAAISSQCQVESVRNVGALSMLLVEVMRCGPSIERDHQVYRPYQLFQSPARIRFQFDPEGRKSGGKDRPFTVDIRLELPGWGKIEAWARWFEKQIDIKLYLEDAGIASILEEHSGELSAELRESGFQQVSVEVRADPVRLYK